MSAWLRKNSGWVAVLVTWAIIGLGYAYTRGGESERVSGLKDRLDKMEPDVKKISALESRLEKMSNLLSREVIPNLNEINKKLGPLPRALEQMRLLRDELKPLQDLVASRLMDKPHDIFFGFDSSTPKSDPADRLTRNALGELSLNASLLRVRPNIKILLEGHTDERGTAEYNLGLADRRAQVIKQYLVSAGVEETRIGIATYGKERPFVLGHDESAWKWNRRVRFVPTAK